MLNIIPAQHANLIDLHRHLEGSVRISTLADICRMYKIPLPSYDQAVLSMDIQLTGQPNSAALLKAHSLLQHAFADKESIARIAYEAVEDASADNIGYLELRFSPEYIAHISRLDIIDVMDGVTEGVENAVRNFSIKAKLIVNIRADLDASVMKSPWPSQTEIAALAVDYAERGVVGVDLSGNERGFHAGGTIDALRVVKDANLGITIHADKQGGPEDVKRAIINLGAKRIGHGIGIIHNQNIMKLAVDKGVALEICPTYDVISAEIPSIHQHPIRKIFDYGVNVTINTDYPTICNTGLANEINQLQTALGFTNSDIEKIMLNAKSAAFSKN